MTLIWYNTVEMNPAYRIVASKTAKTALAVAVVQRLYRQSRGCELPLHWAIALRTVATTLLAADIVISLDGPRTFGYPNLYTQLTAEQNHVALTFDDGPDPDNTPKILKHLQRHSVSATFFLVAQKAEQYPDIVSTIVDQGHSVAYHGYNHNALAERSYGYCSNQIALSKDVLGSIAVPYFRPPYGFKSQTLQRACLAEDVVLTAWSVNPKDYMNLEPQVIIDRVTAGIFPGAIILLHDWSKSTQIALPTLMSSIRDRGYSFVRLPETTI